MVNILFKTGRFNLSKIGPDFINDCCFGEDFLAWLHFTINWRWPDTLSTNPFKKIGAGH